MFYLWVYTPNSQWKAVAWPLSNLSCALEHQLQLDNDVSCRHTSRVNVCWGMASHSSWRAATSMSWSIVVHGNEIRPVLFMQGHNGWIKDVIQVVWACHCTIHIVWGSSALTRHTCPHCNTTNTKGSSGDNSGWCIALSLMSPTSMAAIMSAQRESTFIREQHWGPLVPRPAQMLPGPCKTTTPLPGGVVRYPCRSSSTQTTLM